jgi:hypothetical protein
MLYYDSCDGGGLGHGRVRFAVLVIIGAVDGQRFFFIRDNCLPFRAQQAADVAAAHVGFFDFLFGTAGRAEELLAFYSLSARR